MGGNWVIGLSTVVLDLRDEVPSPKVRKHGVYGFVRVEYAYFCVNSILECNFFLKLLPIYTYAMLRICAHTDTHTYIYLNVLYVCGGGGRHRLVATMLAHTEILLFMNSTEQSGSLVPVPAT